MAFFQAVPEQQLRRTIAAVTAQHGPAREVEHLDVARDHGSLVVAFGTARLAMRMVLASSAPYVIEGLLITGEAPEPATAAQESDPR
ncbi:hypothetical protein [Coralloluteibacterium thermophilus]|uniref:Uncharacterized protein n=1 Tax=Coralloluteibacterium thermophilum TaxID=2707049 RepID=A0ABV9NLJ6_9GAMM